VQMMPMSHDLLGRYVGAPREVITQHMNELRKRGWVSYSRQGILRHRDRDLFQACLADRSPDVDGVWNRFTIHLTPKHGRNSTDGISAKGFSL
jgi:hypothetical protein